MNPLVSKTVDTLASRLRTTAGGAKSLAHICVVVPTAQSGRRLRRALAERFGALVPPLVRTPPQMLLDEDDPAVAGRTASIRAMRTALDEPGCERTMLLERARELVDLRTLLGAKALSFADVADAIRDDLPDEAERWRELATVETRYCAALEKSGLKDRIVAMKSFRPDFPGVEEIIRFDDPAAFDLVPPAHALIPFQAVFPSATPADEATRIADYFAAVRPSEALPALCIADPELFPEIETAFKARGFKIHNPASAKLATSSLGHLVAQLVALIRTGSYAVFSAFIRGGDVRRWLMRELKLDDEAFSAALADLDNRQAEYLPEKVDDLAPKTRGSLRAVFEFVKVQLRKKGLRAILAGIFRDFTLDERDAGAREFAAAAEVVNRLIGECDDDWELFELRLGEETYSLEPDEGDVILTDGWMELPFLEADELVIAGFHELCVPESTVGHPYLPDSLRRRLGLPDNASRERRDRAILHLAVAGRADGATRVYFHTLDAKGDVLKPSRLLFETDDDDDLVRRVRAFYGLRAGTKESSAPDLPPRWKLHLPVPPDFSPLSKISPTRLDSYLRCPFTYYLKDRSILGDKRMDDRAEELQSWEYGNLAHEALEAFGASELKDETDPARIRDFLEERIDAQLVDRFALSIPAIVAMQGESVKRRLAGFAAIQAKRRAAGWRIAAVEKKLEIQYDHTRLYGKCDRIDHNERTGEWCVIDYKTWDRADKARCRETKRDGSTAWKSLQLALYCAMLDASGDGEFAAARLENISSCYCVLGKTLDDTCFTEPMLGAFVPEAESLVRNLITRIEHGLFWPPAPAKEWKYDFSDWLMPSPEQSVDEDWIADQLRRLEDGGFTA